MNQPNLPLEGVTASEAKQSQHLEERIASDLLGVRNDRLAKGFKVNWHIWDWRD